MSINVRAAGARATDLVAEEIRALLARRRVSGRELARQLGVSPNWVSLRLTGAQPIDVNDLALIAEALDVKIADLIPRDQREATLPYLSVPTIMGDHPSGRRDHTHPASHQSPSGPGRTSRVPRGIAA